MTSRSTATRGRRWRRSSAFRGARAFFSRSTGSRTRTFSRGLLGRDLGPALVDALGREKEEQYRTLYRPHLAPVAGAQALIDKLRATGIKIALASSAPPENRTMVLEGLGWSETFHAVIVPEGMPGKPAPDIFLATAKALEVVPSECLVFEDAWAGVKAAATAGMTVIGITTNADPGVLERAGAIKTIPDFTTLPDDLGTLMP